MNAGTAQRRAVGGDPRDRDLARPIPVTSRLVGDVLQATASLVMMSTRDVPTQPAWIVDSSSPGGTPAARSRVGSPPAHWPAEEILPAKNMLCALAVAGGGCRVYHVAHPSVLQPVRARIRL